MGSRIERKAEYTSPLPAAQKQKYTYQIRDSRQDGVSFHPFDPNHLLAPRDPLESRAESQGRDGYDRSSSPAAGEPVGRWRAGV